jgi:hypothetical protein
MSRRTALPAALSALALTALGGLGIAGAQPPHAPDASLDVARSGQARAVSDDMRDRHRRMTEHHREMMRDPDMRGLMRDPQMRAMHRDMMRMHDRVAPTQENTTEMAMGTMD